MQGNFDNQPREVVNRLAQLVNSRTNDGERPLSSDDKTQLFNTMSQLVTSGQDLIMNVFTLINEGGPTNRDIHLQSADRPMARSLMSDEGLALAKMTDQR